MTLLNGKFHFGAANAADGAIFLHLLLSIKSRLIQLFLVNNQFLIFLKLFSRYLRFLSLHSLFTFLKKKWLFGGMDIFKPFTAF